MSAALSSILFLVAFGGLSLFGGWILHRQRRQEATLREEFSAAQERPQARALSMEADQ